MILRALSLSLLAIPAVAQDVAVPSGQPVSLFEVIPEERPEMGETWVRFRFLAPGIARGPEAMSFEETEADMLYLCENVALPAILADDRNFDLVFISLSDREVALGTADPEATQFFEGYRPEAATCILEEF